MRATAKRPAPTVDQFRAFASRQIEIATRHSRGGLGRNPFWLGWLQAFGQCIDWLEGKKVEGEPFPKVFTVARDTIAREGDVRYRIVERAGRVYVRREVLRWKRDEDFACDSRADAQAKVDEWAGTAEFASVIPPPPPTPKKEAL
jgi:hypothetical protein